MKKVSLSLLALAITSTVASAAGQFQGFYMGGNTGYSRAHVDGKVKANTIFGNAKKSKHHIGNGALLETFLGYGSTLGQSGFYLGGELGIGYDFAHFNKKLAAAGESARLEMKKSFFFNASARFGYVICNHTLLFTRVGLQGYAKKAKVSVEDGKSKKYSRSGLLLGLGAEHALTKNLFLRGEYQFNTGHRHTHKLTVAGIGTVKSEVKTPSHKFLIGVGYKF